MMIPLVSFVVNRCVIIFSAQILFLLAEEVMNLKIYFCGSIRGGYQDAKLYQRIIQFMKQDNCALTEHIGSPNIRQLEERQSDEDIYLQDTGWLKKADLVIAECTTPSLGVGYELSYAEHLHKPVYIFYNRNRTQLSAMLIGDKYFHLLPYQKEEEIYQQLKKILK